MNLNIADLSPLATFAITLRTSARFGSTSFFLLRAHYLLVLIKLPPKFQDFATLYSNDKGPSEAFLAHCQREFLHAQWRELLDDDFLKAYEHGIVIECCDGQKRRFYLRIFAYSADYPEKYVFP